MTDIERTHFPTKDVAFTAYDPGEGHSGAPIDITNEDRGQMVAEFIEAFHRAYYYHSLGEDIGIVISDFIADCGHLFDTLKREDPEVTEYDEFSQVVSNAMNNYLEEVDEALLLAEDDEEGDNVTSVPCHLPRWFNERTGMCEHTDHDEPITNLHLDGMSCYNCGCHIGNGDGHYTDENDRLCRDCFGEA